MKIRKAAVCGSFYPSKIGEIEKTIQKYLNDAKPPKINGTLRALVVPHAGFIYSGPTAAYGYKLLGSHGSKFSRILLLGPSHYAGFYGACESGFDFFETPLGKLSVEKISNKVDEKYRDLMPTILQAHIPEHCLEVQMPFIQMTLGNSVKIVPLLLGEVDCEALAYALLPLCDSKTLIIASSDLSHYHSYADAIKLDEVANVCVPSNDISTFEKSGDACGKKAILTLMHIARLKGFHGEFLNYKNSGDTAGSKISVVGYGCYAFYKKR